MSLYHARRVTSHIEGGSVYETVQSSTSLSFNGCGGLSTETRSPLCVKISKGRFPPSPPSSLRALPNTITLLHRICSKPTIFSSSLRSRISKSKASGGGREGNGGRR